VKVLLGLDYYRLGLTHSLRASRASTSRPERNRACREAQGWFRLSEPSLTAAAALKNSEWQAQAKVALDRMTQEAEICTRILTASRQ
jgi:hypothetical protein